MEIKIIEESNKGYALATEDEKKAGMMSYSIASSNLIIIDHTEVEPGFEGRSVGKQMLYQIVEMARKKDIKILPLCPFANAMFKKITTIQDVLK